MTQQQLLAKKDNKSDVGMHMVTGKKDKKSDVGVV